MVYPQTPLTVEEGPAMQLMDFVDACDVRSKTDVEVFELFCYYLTKEKGTVAFSVKKMLWIYEDAGLPAPDVPALKKAAGKYPSFRPFGIEGTLRFGRDVLRGLDKKYGHLWEGGSIVREGGTVKGTVMRLTDFAEACDMVSKPEIDNFELICYYLAKENVTSVFSVKNVFEMYGDVGLEISDRPALEKQARKHTSFQNVGIEGTLKFQPEAYGSLDSRYGHLWTAMTAAPVHAAPLQTASVAAAPAAAPAAGIEVLSEAKFCGKRDGFDRLIVQINSSYRNGSFDACAAVMRRLLESALIFSFQANGVDSDILGGDGRYLGLFDIIRKAVENKVLDLSKIRSDLMDVSRIGDYSGQGPMYTFGANDINSVRNAYRNVLETLFLVSKLP
jgi:hypothetical protein